MALDLCACNSPMINHQGFAIVIFLNYFLNEYCWLLFLIKLHFHQTLDEFLASLHFSFLACVKVIFFYCSLLLCLGSYWVPIVGLCLFCSTRNRPEIDHLSPVPFMQVQFNLPSDSSANWCRVFHYENQYKKQMKNLESLCRSVRFEFSSIEHFIGLILTPFVAWR